MNAYILILMLSDLVIKNTLKTIVTCCSDCCINSKKKRRTHFHGLI
jgi:hypothetical protein